jgi:hypothetical protein
MRIMKNCDSSTDPEQLVQVYKRASRLLGSLEGRPKKNRNRDFAVRYNTLRADTKRIVKDPDFDRLIPRAWYWTPVRDTAIAFILLIAVSVIAYFALGVDGFINYMMVTTVIVILGAIVGGNWLSQHDWYVASTNQEVWDRASMLHDYLVELARRDPNLTVASDQNWRQEFLERNNAELHAELEGARNELRRLSELLDGLETPSQFEVSDQVLDKLSPLERTRLLEAIQAYRVNAWTPAAAVCGMILEGWLQRLCRDNSIRLGGMRGMIARLGEAGLLYGLYWFSGKWRIAPSQQDTRAGMVQAS